MDLGKNTECAYCRIARIDSDAVDWRPGSRPIRPSTRATPSGKPKKLPKGIPLSILQFGDDAWFVTYPGFNMNPDEYITPISHMSYEFATFLRGWDIGDFGPSEFHTRNFVIAQRKSCYPQPLMNALGVFTEAGKMALARAQTYTSLIRKHWESQGFAASDIPAWHQASTMDTILLAAPLHIRHISYLKTLYNHVFPPKSALPTQFGSRMPGELEFEYRNFNGREYLMTGILRPYPQRRKDFEFLVKLGLVGLDNLPKLPTNRGKGRAPIGAYLTDQGRKFYEDYRIRYDPQLLQRAELMRSMQPD